MSMPRPVQVVPDPRRRAPGRGASLHRDPGCVALAERRRSFARALRVSGPFDLTAVREYVSGGSVSTTASGGNPVRAPVGSSEWQWALDEAPAMSTSPTNAIARAAAGSL